MHTYSIYSNTHTHTAVIIVNTFIFSLSLSLSLSVCISISYPGPGPNLKFLPEVESVKTAVQKLKQQGVNKIIALGHAGINIDKKVAEEVDGVDIVVGGHTNTFLYTGTTCYIAKAGCPVTGKTGKYMMDGRHFMQVLTCFKKQVIGSYIPVTVFSVEKSNGTVHHAEN